MTRAALKDYATLRNLTFAFALLQFVWLVWFFYTGLGGSQELVAYLLSIALILQLLFMYQQDYLYKWLPPIANHVLVAVYIGVLLYVFIYFHFEFERIAIYAQGSFTRGDFVVGLLMFLLVMELSRLAHPVLFWTNVILIVYTLWGYLSPLDFFWHPGTSFYRVVTSSTVEFSTGIYGLYGQLALTLIAAFLLLAGVANGFEAQRAMINVVRLIAGRSRQLIPQTAVVGSSAIGMISGSGSANAAVVGTITIPLMMRYGVPGTFAAAVETAASMGGLIMPPMMGVGAFLMSEFLGVPYWDVVKRGFALAFVYYASIGVAVYLLCVRLLPRDAIEKPQVPVYDKIKTTIFFSSVLYLLYLMGFVGKGELLAALYTATFMFVLLLATFIYFKYALKDPALANETLFGSLRRAIETHAEMTSYLTLLLATLGIMIGLFTVTGFINRMGAMLLDLGAWNIIAMIFMAWIFGWLAGAGLPPTATYIIGAVVIVRPMQEARHQSVGRALLRVPDVGVGRAVAADLAHRRGFRPHRQRLVPAHDVRGAEDLRTDHADDVRDLHPLEHGGEPRLAADRRHDPGADQHARHHLRDVRTVRRESRRRHRAAGAAGCGRVRGHVPSRHDDVGDRRLRSWRRRSSSASGVTGSSPRRRRGLPLGTAPGRRRASSRRCWPRPGATSGNPVGWAKAPDNRSDVGTAGRAFAHLRRSRGQNSEATPMERMAVMPLRFCVSSRLLISGCAVAESRCAAEALSVHAQGAPGRAERSRRRPRPRQPLD